MEIKLTQMSDLECVIKIYDRARKFMAENGNPCQWGISNPSKEQIINDIRAGKSYKCIENDEILGVFYYAQEDEPTYAVIKDGRWKKEGPYGVIHRIASAGTHKGIGRYCIDWAYEQCQNIRIDTHKDNLIMQNLLKRMGFEYCGIIYVQDGSPRIAYQKYGHYCIFHR